jgi:hypothetical protein
VGKNAKLLIIKACGINSYQWALKCLWKILKQFRHTIKVLFLGTGGEEEIQTLLVSFVGTLPEFL